MSGIIIAGAGVGHLVAPLLVSRLIAIYDWRLSSIIVGYVVLAVIVIAAQFLRHDPIKKGQRPYGEDKNEGNQHYFKSETKSFSLKEAVHTAQFWLAFMILLCFGFFMVAVMVHIVPHATDLEISAVSAANILATMGGITILGNYVLGSVADKIGNRWVFIIGFILMALALCGLLPARELWMLYLFAVVFGFNQGGMATSESPLVAGLFGLRSHGLIYGVLSLGFTAGASVGPFVTGYIFDLTGGYQVAFLVCVAFSIFGLILTVLLRPTKRLAGRI